MYDSSNVRTDVILGEDLFARSKTNFGKPRRLRKRGKKGGVRQRVRKLRRKNRVPLPSMILANVQSLRNKTDELQGNVLHLREYRKACLMALTETWLTDMDSDTSLRISGFGTPVRLDRNCGVTRKSHGGGVRRSPVPVIYYTNLLTSNLIQICIMIVWILRIKSSIAAVINLLCVMASLYFRVCIALERCLYITYPLLDCLRQSRSSVLVCVLVWAFCIVSVPLAIVFYELIRLSIYAALPGPLFIFCLARTFRALPAATSVPTEEKRRSLGILILLFFSYFIIVVYTIIYDIFLFFSVVLHYISLISILLSPFVDLILFLFMRKGRIDKLLTCLCSADGRADHQCD
ncbi:uncharacterized protein LOC120443369 [Oreochromis aureus]|uniref:G-protein coupled receptors family 1 profile domain-containing protein n=1 Tax=Oreochromis aureus TaxID=47969 RepID=A0AAZ1XV17_OREAU|nr:uncharacterized protein LOC120443369 [Oreochromis aureus]